MKRKFESAAMDGEEGLYNHGISWWRGSLIGKGAFGSVYIANLKKPKSRNMVYPPIMAVKSAEVSESSSLQKEKEVYNNLYDSPFILQCFGEETTTDPSGIMFYNILLEYASGGTLASLIKQSGGRGLPESDVKRYTRFILKGIDYIHTHGYVHCDLKPQNVLFVSSVGDQFVPKIGDLGLAKKIVRSNSYIGGTTSYMAPETVADGIQETPSDIWALGCIVFEMLTGNKVWYSSDVDTTNAEILKKIGDPYELPKIPSQISKDAKDFLKACLVRKPAFRFTAEMLLDHPFLSGCDYEVYESEDEELSTNSVDTLCDSDCDNESCACRFSEEQSGSFYSSTLANGGTSKLGNHADHDLLHAAFYASPVIH
ncbi:mitogen-activated protein kinase kinase kinase 20-like [Mercurialis annua]|uniref:mitogen-activated protein kinase kinase kinase 20-like n=1 Tax=Mercurialis annua TaxID=3986 RepID=UPI00215E1853|nr:mitogen-activated protein kinase kinase kinase 20-like [Mercurialis annua]